MAIVSISPNPMMSPLRYPIVNIKTNTTITTDSNRFSINEEIASSTLSGWKNIFSVLNPMGSVFIASANLASTAFPTSGTITDDSIAIHIAIAGSPLTKNPLR